MIINIHIFHGYDSMIIALAVVSLCSTQSAQTLVSPQLRCLPQPLPPQPLPPPT